MTLDDKERIFKAYLDDKRQSLQAPLASVAAYTESLLELPAITGDGAMFADASALPEQRPKCWMCYRLCQR